MTSDGISQELKMFPPIRVTFGHGNPALEQISNLSCEIFSDIEHRNQVQKVIISNPDNTKFESKPDQSAFSKNYIAVRNRSTNTVRWYPLNSFLMTPHISKPEKSALSNKNKKQLSVGEAINELNKVMGSKKTKRNLIGNENNQIELDNIEKTVADAVEKKSIALENPSVSSNGNSGIAAYLPPRDQNATSIELVYKVYDLISPEIMDSLEDIALEVLKKRGILSENEDRLSTFIVKIYALIPKPDSVKIKLLIFADVLLKFLREPMKKIRLKEPVFCKFSSPLNKKIVDEFCTIGIGGDRNRSPAMRDKALCYIIVCIFLSSDYYLNLSILSEFVSPVDFNKLPLLIRAVGAVKERSNSAGYVLKLPLAGLVLNRGSRLKRKQK